MNTSTAPSLSGMFGEISQTIVFYNLHVIEFKFWCCILKFCDMMVCCLRFCLGTINGCGSSIVEWFSCADNWRLGLGVLYHWSLVFLELCDMMVCCLWFCRLICMGTINGCCSIVEWFSCADNWQLGFWILYHHSVHYEYHHNFVDIYKLTLYLNDRFVHDKSTKEKGPEERKVCN